MNFNRVSIAATAVLLQIFVTVSAAQAQQRPLLTEDPRTIAEGAVVSEFGFAYSHRTRFPVSGLGGNQFSFLVNGLNIGLGSRAEFQIAGVAHNFVWIRENGSGRRNDWGDFSLSTKMKIVEEARYRPVISFRPTIVLPNTNNEKGLGTDGTHFFGNILAGKTVRGAFVFGNIGLGILDDSVTAAAQQDVLTYGIAVWVPATSRLSVVSEWNGVHNPQVSPSPGGESRGQVRFGIQLKAAGLRWDVGATAGTTRFDHKAGIVAGFTKEMQLWNR
jgi:hypothetical protein